jgi:hypothetical protein
MIATAEDSGKFFFVNVSASVPQVAALRGVSFLPTADITSVCWPIGYVGDERSIRKGGILN